ASRADSTEASAHRNATTPLHCDLARRRRCMCCDRGAGDGHGDADPAGCGDRVSGGADSVIVEPDYRGFRIEANAAVEGERWNADVRLLRLFSRDKSPRTLYDVRPL